MNEEDLMALPGVERIEIGGLATPAPTSEDGEEISAEEPQQQTTEQQPQEPAEQVDPNAGMDNPLSGFLENAAVGVRDFIDNTFQGDQLSKEDIAGNREEMRQEEATATEEQREVAMQNPISATVAEGTRATLGGIAGVVEQPVRFAQQIAGQDASFNLGIAENKTAVGEFARTTISMMGIMKGVGAVAPGLTGGSTIAGRLARETAKGAIADFIFEEGDGNLTNMLEDMNPDLKDTWLTALAHEDDDNVYIRKLKNTVEGGIFGAALDGMSELYGAIRAGKKAAKAGGSREQVEQAVTEYFEQTELELNAFSKPTSSPITANSFSTESMKPQIDAAKELPVQATLNLGDTNAIAGPAQVRRRGNADPGVEARLNESRANNAYSVETNMWEPNERAAKTAGYEFNDVVTSQIDQANAGNPVQGGSKAFTVDETFKRILASTDQNKAISEVIKAAEEGTDVKAIIAKLRTTNDRQFAESIPILNDFLEANKNADGTTNWNALEKLVETDTGGAEKAYMTIEGGIAVRGLQVDIANQLRDTADAMKGVDEIGGDSFRQAQMLIDRLRVLDRMNLAASYDAGTRLQARNVSTLNVRKALEDGEFDGAAAKRIDESNKKFDELQEKLSLGDPQAKAEFSTLADSLALANGDPDKVLKFWELFRKAGSNGLKAGLYNGFLSTTTSQLRNLTGNAFNTMLRPATQALGFARTGDFSEARIQLAAYNGLIDNLHETFKIAKMSWDSSSIDSQAIRYDDGYSAGSARVIVDQAKAMAETSGERAAAQLIDFQYSLFANPWARMPTRGLGAVDDAVRTLVARMELKKDAMRSSFEKGQGLKVDPDRYAKLVDLKIDGKGNILDEQLLNTAKDVTFQTELTGFGSMLQQMSEKNPFVRLMFPFIKTPINIMRTTFTYMPIANRFVGDYKAAMAGNDEALKALYRGREAAGVMTIGSAVSLATTGNLTGRGPADQEKRKIWLQNNQPNSIKTPFGWISYETIEPLNTIFSMAADLTQLANAGNDSLYDRNWAQAVYTISASLVDKSYFKGFIDVAGMINPADPRWFSNVSKKTVETANTVILPWSGARAQLGKLLAPGKQEFDQSYQQAFASALPGLRNVMGAQRVDIFTNKEMNPADYAGHIWNTLTPFDVGSSDNNNLAGRLGELGVDVNFEYSDTFKGIKLTPHERQMLNKYIAESGLGKELDRLMSKDWFKDEVEEWKEGNLASEGTRWMDAISKELSYAKRQAKARMLRENPTFADKVDLNDRQRSLVKQGRYEKGESVQEQLQMLMDFN